MERWAGDYVYFGQDYELTWLDYSGDRSYGYVHAVAAEDRWGTWLDNGTTHSFTVRIADGAGTVLETAGAVTMDPYSNAWDYPLNCASYYYGDRYCYANKGSQTGRMGWASGVTGL